MDMVKSETTSGPQPAARKRKKAILEEEEYLAEIEGIIERDFFPDIPVMRQQLEQFEGVHKLFNQQTPVVPAQTPGGTQQGSIAGSGVHGSTFGDTPLVGAQEAEELRTPLVISDGAGARVEAVASANAAPKASVAKRMSLDEFLGTHTSEDNASFQVLQEQFFKRKRQKHAHHLEDKNVPLLEGKRECDGYGTTGQAADTLALWKHVPKNKLFYDSSQTGVVKRTEREIAETVQGPPKEIKHGNTRFPVAGSDQDSKHGLGAPVLRSSEGTKDYNYVATPLPVAGVNVSPIMTWGELGGTPIRLDGSMTPGFRINEMSQRDKVGKDLAASARKSLAFKRAAMSGTPFQTKSGKILSAAGQKLASAMRVKTPGTDLQLRASYSGTPYRNLKDGVRGVTPLVRVKKKGSSKPVEIPDDKAKGRITDGLLNLDE